MSKKFRASSLSLRKNSKALPWISLVPDFVTRLMVEPPFLWACAVGDSGNGKSPGSDCLMRDVLPEIERRMLADFPDRLRQWRAAEQHDKVNEEEWKSEVRNAQKRGVPPPMRSSRAAGRHRAVRW